MNHSNQHVDDPALDAWVQAAAQSIQPLAMTLGMTDVQITIDSDPPQDLPGNYISVYAEQHTYLIGIVGEEDNLIQLVKFMIGAADDEELSDEDTWDGVGEIANILVGNMKTELSAVHENMSIGLPMMTTGAIVYPKPDRSTVVGITLDGIPIFILLQRHPLPAEVKRQRSLEIELKEQESMLEDTRRLDAIGQLAAGIAHEINTPTQYIGDNCQFLSDAFQDILALISRYADLKKSVSKGNNDLALLNEIEELEDQYDLEFLNEEIPRAITQSLEGVGRVSSIVSAMKAFSHPAKEKGPADINKAIETTVTVCRNEWKYFAETVLNLDASLPHVSCIVGEINQVLMNLIVNAAHAITEKNGSNGPKGTIEIRTSQFETWAQISVRDTGNGIKTTHQKKIFEPFFTTKEVGKGTGQGLSIAYSIIVKNHNGQLFFETKEGEGTTFFIRLPLDAATA